MFPSLQIRVPIGNTRRMSLQPRNAHLQTGHAGVGVHHGQALIPHLSRIAAKPEPWWGIWRAEERRCGR